MIVQSSPTTLVTIWLGVATILVAAAAAWLAMKASVIKDELEAATQLIAPLKDDIAGGNQSDAMANAEQLRDSRSQLRARRQEIRYGHWPRLFQGSAQTSLLWEKSPAPPTTSPSSAVTPLVNVFDSLNWDTLMPNDSGTNLGPIQQAAPNVASAAHAVRASAERLEAIDADQSAASSL